MRKFEAKVMLCAMLAIMALASCSSRLEQVVASVNKECPMSMGIDGIVSSMTIEGDSVVVEYIVYDNIFNMDSLNAHISLLKEYMLAELQNADEETKEDFKVIADESTGLTYKYVGYTSGKTVLFTLSSTEMLSALVKSPETKATLAVILKFTNLAFPLEALPGHIVERARLDGNFIVYDISVDENRFNIKRSKENAEKMMDTTKSRLDPSNPLIKMFLAICRQARVGLAYRYVGNNTGESFVIEIPYSELPVNDRSVK